MCSLLASSVNVSPSAALREYVSPGLSNFVRQYSDQHSQLGKRGADVAFHPGCRVLAWRRRLEALTCDGLEEQDVAP